MQLQLLWALVSSAYWWGRIVDDTFAQRQLLFCVCIQACREAPTESNSSGIAGSDNQADNRVGHSEFTKSMH